jgi:TRAP-type mannitol/chloroaromatic compound transport system permease large subunit
MINMQCAWITPPYGFNLFIMRAVTPKEISTWDIYKSVVPFIGLQLIALLLVMFVPQIATWLPSVLF